MKKYHAVIFTDMSSKIYHVRPLGAYRIASELRQAGYQVLVIDYFSKWLADLKGFFNLLDTVISDETLFVGYSSTFFSPTTEFKEHVETYYEYFGEMSAQWPIEHQRMNLINRHIKKLGPRSKILYGGNGANNVTPMLTESGIDYIVQGLADNTVVEIINNIRDNKHIKYTLINNAKVIAYDVTARGFDFTNSQTVFSPDDCFDGDSVLPLETSRGCMFKCSFCEYPLLGRKKNDLSYHRTVNSLTQEVVRNYETFGINKYMIVDDTFNESTSKLEAVYNALENSNIKIEFACYLRADLLERFPEQIPLLRNMGIRSAFLGIETLNPRAAKSVGKNSHTDRIKEVLIQLKDVWKKETMIHGGFIAGLPYDNEETIEEWMAWIYNNPDLIDSYFIQPLRLIPSLFPSDLQKNPQNYGYKQTGANWINNMDYTCEQAEALSHRWMKKSWETGRLKVATWDMLGIQNLGYEFEEIRNFRINSLPFREFSQRYQTKFNTYQQRLLNTVNDIQC